MKKNYENSLKLVLFVILAYVLQLGAARLTWELVRKINSLEFGVETASLALFTIILGIVSGIVLAFTIKSWWKPEPTPQRTVLAVGLLGFIPLLAIILKLYIGAFGPHGFPFLRLGWNEMYEWTVHSQVPSLWLGFVIGWLVKR